MDSLDLVTIITYICGILGGILLVLCIVLAFLFIVVQCKAYFCPRDSQYSVVPIAQNGVAIENGFNSKKGYVPGDDPHQEPLLSLMDESGNARKNGKKPRIIRSQHENHSQPPVKKKLLWKKGRKKSITRMPAKQTNEDEKVEFSDEDLDVPRDRIFRKNPNVIRFKSRSKSDWDIHDMPGESPINSSEEDFAAYTRNLRLLQNGEEVGLSQYFDALETINEVTEGEEEAPEFLSDKGSYTESEVSIASQPQAEGVEAKPKDLPSQPSEPDPIIGRYRMTSSDGFDEVLRELGVGLMKRKMANSVTPINVIEIDEEGTYVIKTETTLRTTEIRFKMEETFIEVTLDGRTTHTYPTRKGNVIHLDQRGDPIKKEKDSVMIRDFQGDIMHMQIIVGQVVCKRVYERIKED